MSTKSVIVDGTGTGNALKVSDDGTIAVVVHPHPPLSDKFVSRPFRQLFTQTGIASGTSDMVVNGAVTEVDYFIVNQGDFDVYIKLISVVIGDGGNPTLSEFGNLSALTNGVEFSWLNAEIGEVILHDGIKTNLEFIRLGAATGAIGTGGDAYLADVSGGGAEKSYLPTIDLAQTFGVPYGIRLRASTNDRLTFTIKDDLSALTTMNAIAYGIQIRN